MENCKADSLFFLLLIAQVAAGVIINLPDGQIKGVTQNTSKGLAYNAFYGIRYGQKPENELRFLPPVAVEPWTGVFDATVEKGICYQVTEDDYRETEDCLLLNVYTPVLDLQQNDSSAKLPVMFFIHGGGFVEGSGIYAWGVGPQYFIEYGVIMVAINYRLGPFGYLSTGDDVIPGNIGMKDQILALQWVQRNIQYFGGDSEKVTIFGQSAGSASCSYLLLSPLAQGLFRAAILESGSALSPWAYQRDQVEITYKTAALLNPEFETNRNSTELLQFLQSVSATELDQASYNFTRKLEDAAHLQIAQGFFYAPMIEHEHQDAFLTKMQYGSFENGSFNRVPVLMGFNSQENMFMMNEYLPILLKEYDNSPNIIVPNDMHIDDQNTLLEVGRIIKTFYSPEKDLKNNELVAIELSSNNDFDKSVIKQAELQAPYVPVYLYEFTYRGKMGNNPFKINGSDGVTHGEEQNYIFNRWYSNEIPDNTNFSLFSQDDVNVHYTFMSLFTNFAKELNPTPREEDILQNITWATVQPNRICYLEIGKDLTLHHTTPKNQMYDFWDGLYKTFAVTPYDSF